MAISPDKLEVGSTGFMWNNLAPDRLLGSIRLHVYYAHEMKAVQKWQGDQFINHYNRIYFVEAGEAVLEFESHSMTMKPGQLYLIPPYTLKSHCSSGDFHFHWAHFHALIDGDLDFIALFGKPSEIKVDQPSEVRAVFHQLTEAVAAPAASETLYRNMLLTQLLQPFLKEILDNKDSVTQHDYVRFLPALAMIERSLSSQFSIAEVAESIGVSPEHFSRTFKETFKVSPKRYIQKKRIGLAKQMLLLSKQTMGNIAQECGFCDQYHFSKSFKQEEGCSPTAYKKRYADSTPNTQT